MKSSRLQKVLNHFVGLLLFAFIFVNALSAFAGPGKTTYQAKIVKPDGYPLEASSVNFKFTILDPAGSCILYAETYSSVNMGSTSGLISFALGSGVKTYPTSATTFEQVFSNITPSLSCDTGGPASYSPAATDIRKIVMQFHDGTGWQTLPAMSINAVPYAMYANEATKLNGLQSSDFVQVSTVPTCAASEALRYTGAGFTCVAVGNSVTSGTVISALGYTPADGASVTALTTTTNAVSTTVASVSSTVFSVSSTVTSLQNSVAASFAAITSSQWTTSGTNIFYNTGNIGIGTTTPVTKLDVSGGVRIGAESTTCAPALAGTLRYNASNVEYCNGTSWQAFGVSGAGITNINGSTSGTQSFANATGGTAPAFNTSNGVHTLNIPLASAGSVTAGLISNTDYTTFTNKITSSAASIAQVLGYVPADNAASGTYAQKANNLSDLTNVATARTNLGLGTLAVGNSIDLGSASATGILADARLANQSGVTSGTQYTKVTVDGKGRVTSGAQLSSGDVTTALGYTPANSATIVSSQWSTSGTTINYMTGNVGIGTSDPASVLHVTGSESYNNLQITSPNYSALTARGGSTSGWPLLQLHNQATGGKAWNVEAGRHSVDSFGIYDTNSGTTRLFISSIGHVGIGTTTPVTKLDVSGGVRISMESATCAASFAGTLRYNAGNVEYCNGTIWSAFGVATSGLTSLNGTTSQTQSFANGTAGTAPAFNTANGVHTLNIPLASTGSVTAGLISNADYTTFGNKITSSAASIAQVLGYVPADNAASGTYAQKANNLSDLTNVATARTNLGLGTLATASSIDLGSASATGTLAIARLPSFVGDATIAATSNTIILSNSGVTAGTYTKVTVDSKGRVTSSSTLASSDVTTALGYTPASASASTQWTTSGSAIYYNTGNVGIGTATPSERLEIAGGILLNTNNARLRLQRTGGAASPNYIDFNNDSTSKLHFRSISNTDTGANVRMTIDADTGSVGIGTDPSYGLLDVNGGARFTVGTTNFLVDGTAASMFRTNSSGAGGANIDLLHYNNGSGILANAVTGSVNFKGSNGSGVFTTVAQLSSRMPTVSAGNEAGTLVLSTMDNGLMSDRINITGGNVGIGTAAPTAKLHLAAGTSSTASFKFTSGTLLTSAQSGAMEYDGTNFYLTDSTNTRRAIAANTNPGTYDNVSNINSSSNITLTPTGSVVVSSTTASTNSSTGALIVKGGMGVAGDLNVAGTISGSAVIKATGYRANQGSPDSNDSSTNGYAFGADGDTGMFSPGSGAANGVLAFYGNNAELMRITASGAVGIGTSTPTAPIEAAKNFGASGAANSILKLNARGTASSGFGGSIDFLSSNEIAQNDFIAARISSAWEVADNGFGLSFFTKNTGANGGATAERMRISNSGYVGIGTSSPSQILEVKTTSTDSAIRLSNTTAGSKAWDVTSGGNGNYTPGYFAIRNVTDSLTAMIISPTGNVGIGTTSPSAKLSVSGTALFGANGNAHVGGVEKIHIAGANSNPTMIATTNTGIRTMFMSAGALNTIGTDGGDISFRTSAAWTASDPSVDGLDRMRITAAGNVGIGTTSPGSKLEVGGGALFGGQTVSGANVGSIHISSGQLSSDSFTRYGYWNGVINTGIYDVGYVGSTGAFTIRNVSSGSENPATSVYLASSGNLGIGTTSPSEKLEVNGFVKAQGFKTSAMSVGTELLYVRGTGLNNNASRLVKLGNQTLVNSSVRGLTLTIITASTHTHVSSTNYDVYGSTIDSDNLATALNNLTRDKIGVLSSYDSWESSITNNLRVAARRLGLYKLAVATEYRAPYAAIFYGAGTVTNNTEVGRQAYEILQNGDADSSYALVTTWLTEDGFVGQNLTNVLTSGNPNTADPAVLVNSAGNVGIGTTSPATRFDVAGGGGSVFQVVASANANATPDVDSDFLVRLMPQTTGGEGGHLEFKGSGSYQDWTIDSTAGDLRFFEPNQSRTSTKTRGGFNFMVNPSTTSASTQFTALMITNNGNVGVGITSPTAKLDVNGQIAGKSYKTRLFQAGGRTSTSCTLSASNTTMADQFCDLSVAFTLTDPASVQINYTIAMSAGPSGGRHLVTGIDIDGAVVTTVLTGITSQEATPYWSNSQTHFADLAVGSHTIKVKYRTPAGGTSNPSANDWENRILQVMILGYQ